MSLACTSNKWDIWIIWILYHTTLWEETLKTSQTFNTKQINSILNLWSSGLWHHVTLYKECNVRSSLSLQILLSTYKVSQCHNPKYCSLNTQHHKTKKSYKTDLKMEALLSSQTLVNIYHLTWHNVPKDLNRHQHGCENLKSLKVSYLIADILVQYQQNSTHNKNHKNIMVESVSTRWLQKKIILINIQLKSLKFSFHSEF